MHLAGLLRADWLRERNPVGAARRSRLVHRRAHTRPLVAAPLLRDVSELAGGYRSNGVPKPLVMFSGLSVGNPSGRCDGEQCGSVTGDKDTVAVPVGHSGGVADGRFQVCLKGVCAFGENVVNNLCRKRHL